MRICSRCNKEISNVDTRCPRCGFSLIKDKYGKRIEPLTNNLSAQTIVYNNANTNVKQKTTLLIITMFVIAFITAIIPIIIMVNDSFNEDTDNINEVDMNLINDLLDDVKMIASDYNFAWLSYEENNAITLNEIDNDIELDITEMTNESCIAFNDTAKEEDLLKCILLSYEGKNIYKDVNKDMLDLYNYVGVYEVGDVRDALVEIYGYAYELYYLPGSVDVYEQYKNKYDETLNELNKMVNLLEDKEL